MSQGIVFVWTCPRCQREQAQEGYTVGALMRLLCAGYRIEAYCIFCDEFWPINIQKRIELGEMVAAIVAAVGASPSPEGRVEDAID